ncbi:hypothetical protein [Streptomyces sp. NPDC046197]|uniref:hypothetical protein n=1 Tax=Streptomyces sp. NPDC046197 TaxID=3154337 RepID=UPI0033F1BF5C
MRGRRAGPGRRWRRRTPTPRACCRPRPAEGSRRAGAQQLLGTAFAEKGNLDAYADTNNLVALYPQAVSGVWPVNPQGCWDRFGYDGSDYAVKSAHQMTAIVNMVHALGA